MDFYKYFAFISYSHADKKAARKLYRRLNNYRLPMTLRGEYARKEGRQLPNRISPIFIDDEEMANSSVMGGMMSGLERSRFLIVVCSPNSARSPYVNSEVEYFLRSGRGNYIIPYIISGKPCSGNPATECYPPAMREPDRLGADVRELKGDAALRVIAMMLQVDMGVLAQREKQKRERLIVGTAAVLIAVALAFGLYNNHMRGRIAEENRRYQISLSDQLLQTGENIEHAHGKGEALMYYARSLQENPSNQIAKMNALICLQSSGWLTTVDADRGGDDNIPAGHETSDDLGVLVGKDKFGYRNYSVYRKDLTVTLVPEGGGARYRAQIPEKYRDELMSGYKEDEYKMLYAALVKRDEEVRLILAADKRAYVYAFEDQGDPDKQVHVGSMIYSEDLRNMEAYLEGETVNVYGVYGSSHDGRALLSLGLVKETPILFDVFERKVIRALDMENDIRITYAAFEKNGGGIALLAKVEPESAMMNTRIRYYDENGGLLYATHEVDGMNQIRNIDYSPDGKALVLCRSESAFVFSTEKAELLCPKLRADRIFERADFTPSGTVMVKYTDGTRNEYELRFFEPVREYAADPPEKQPVKEDDFAVISDDLRFDYNPPDISLVNGDHELLDKAEGLFFLPEGMNDGYLFNPEFEIDRKASVAFFYGFLEEVFYRVTYSEDPGRIIKAEPVVIPGRNTKDLYAFDDMCAVRTSDDYLLGYRNDSTEPFFTIDIGNLGYIESMKWLGGDIIAIEYVDYAQGENTQSVVYTLELWNVRNGRFISRLEYNSESSITDMHYQDGVFSYRKGEEFCYWVLEAEDPDAAAIMFLSKLAPYEQDENGLSRFATPSFTGDMGNWGDVIKCVDDR